MMEIGLDELLRRCGEGVSFRLPGALSGKVSSCFEMTLTSSLNMELEANVSAGHT